MSQAQPNSFGRVLMILIVLVVVVIGATVFLNRHDNRTAGEKVGDAVADTIDAVPEHIDKVGDELTDKEKLDKAGDKLADVGEKASSAVSKAGEKAAAAMSQTSEDIKAAADRQKEQDEAKKAQKS